MPIKIEKHARLNRSPEDGIRILVTRWWPRGLKKENVDEWHKELAPSEDLLNALREADAKYDLLDQEALDPVTLWEWFTERYEVEMQEPEAFASIMRLRDRHNSDEVITLLCACHRSEDCHRSILGKLIAG